METALLAPSEGQSDLKVLNEQERADLLACEETIGRGLQSFVEVGRALQTVRDDRLYRADHKTFEDYCRIRWQMGRAHANRYIDSSKVACILSPIGDTPANEAQARPLTRIRTLKGALDTKAIVRAWKKVVDTVPADDSGRKVITAKVVEELVRPTLRKRAKRRAGLTGPSEDPPTSLQVRSAVDAIIDKKVENATAAEAGPTKESITHEQFLELHGLVLWLKKLTAVPSVETSPLQLRQCAERIGKIVLE